MSETTTETARCGPIASLPSDGYVRLSSIIRPNGPLPISRSAWWAGIQASRYPKPVKLGPRITAWRVADILQLIEQFEKEAA